MRSRSSSLEDVLKVKPGQQQQQSERRKRSAERGEPSGRAERRARHREPPEDTGTVQRNNRTLRNSGGTGTGMGTGTGTGTGSAGGAAKAGRKEKGRDLSRDDLIFLLSLLEGELQARDEVITVLKADKLDVALLEAKYGFVTPQKVLQALQRDAVQGRTDVFQEDIYEKPMEELDKLVEKQRETHGRMLEQLLLAEQAHKQALFKLEDEKRNHGEFMKKSDEFTNLLEQERERLKLLIEQEKSHQERREQENRRQVEALREELAKLKAFALMVVDEQQRLSQQLQQQTANAQRAGAGARRAQQELSSAQARLEAEEQKVARLEAQLRHQSARHHQEQDAMAAKLSGEEGQSRQLRQRLSALSRQLDEVEESNRSLRRTEEELQELRDKISRGECGNSGLMSELEELRKRVLEMEGKDGELMRMEEHCRDLKKKLEKEAGQSQSLKVEVEGLNHRILDMEKLEEAFSRSKQECSSLKSNLERERVVSKVLGGELEVLKVRLRELEAAESQLGQAELVLKEDLTKLKTLTVMLVEERKATAEKLQQMEKQVQSGAGKLQAEQEKVTSVTEKLIEESKKALRWKAELEENMRGVLKEKDELKVKLTDEEEKNNELESKIGSMKKRMQSLENAERERLRNKAKEEQIKAAAAHRYDQEDNQVKELTQEVERLRRKLKDMKAVEGDLLKAEELESLEKRFSSEQEKNEALMAELEASKQELCRYQLAEKNECNQEQLLHRRLKEEEAKSSHLSREVQALKEKVLQYMSTEESMCRMRSEQAALQKKLTQQEVRNKELAREMEAVGRELERYRRFSRSLRPGLSGRRLSDLHLSTKEVQTEPLEPPSAGRAAVVALERAVVNGRLYQEGEAPAGELQPRGCGAGLLNSANHPGNHPGNPRRAQLPFLRGRDSAQQPNGKAPTRQNGDHAQPADVLLSHSPGQPLHIKVTPEHGHGAATLEISGPGPENGPSFTSTAVIPTSGGGPKQRITIIQNATAPPAAKPSSPNRRSNASPMAEEAPSPDRALTPFSVAAYSRTLSPDSSGSATPDRAMSPIQIVSVTSGPPERALSAEQVEVVGGHAVFRLSPERQPGWQVQRSGGGGGPSLITTEDNKIHIHLGGPFLHGAGGPAPPERRTQALAACSSPTSRAHGKMTSSILIKPRPGPVQRPAQITIPLEAFRRPGPTRIPKPKGCGLQKATNGLAANTQSKSPPATTKEAPAHNNNNPHLVNRRL